MPYIAQSERPVWDTELEDLLSRLAWREDRGDLFPGEVNYIITRILHAALGKASYTKINALIGVLECAKLELYRRIVAPYEDDKIDDNGDVYPVSKEN